MRNTIIYASLAILIVACSKEEEPAAEPTATEEPKAAEPAAEPEVAAFDAQTTFNTVCATCHGKTGGGDGPAGQALNPKPAAFSSAEYWTPEKDRARVIKVITEGAASVGGSPVMVAYGNQYTDEQIAELADIVMGFKPEGAGEGAPAEGATGAE